ncbi:MAG TPA: nitrite/sulfite reductase [Frankiaceae bacterium]|nr:nitrite/sulfite reductase [Frankiaceae bacterium]
MSDTDVRTFASFGGAVDVAETPRLLADDELAPSLRDAPSFADVVELDRFEAAVKQYLAGQLDPEEFRRLRLWHGVYGQRHLVDVHMLRTKLPGGVLTADALDAMAEVSDRYSRGWGHITTRQNVQFHFVALPDVPAALKRLAEAGVTSREACGDTVRNVTACHLAGVCPMEVLDVNAAAEAVARHFLRNPLAQNLPRKFKVAASGCAIDCALTGIHDIGILATEVDGVKGFRLMVGGGLGTDPHAAQPIEPLTAPDELIVTAEAILRVWDREMPRHQRARARMKFLVAKMGIETFREKVVAEREKLRCSADYRKQDPAAFLPRREPRAEPLPETPYETKDPFGFALWRETNVIEQRQRGQFVAYVSVRMGDVTTEQFRTLAKASRELGVEWRTTVRQNLVARDVRPHDVPRLYDILAEAGLNENGAERASNVVACPGAETCNLALVASRGVASATIDALRAAGLGDVPLSINVSGCPNSCGQQQMADIGLSGQVRRVGTDEAPGYRILLGGRVTVGGARFGQYVAKAPAKRTPEAVVAVVGRFRDERRAGERFGEWVDRVGAEAIGESLAAFDVKRTREEAPEDFTDWGDTNPFQVILGRGECAG